MFVRTFAHINPDTGKAYLKREDGAKPTEFTIVSQHPTATGTDVVIGHMESPDTVTISLLGNEPAVVHGCWPIDLTF